MTAMGHPAAAPEPGTLRRLLLAARERTLEYARALEAPQLLGPRLAIVNPPLWEIGHVGWFQEHWCLRYRAQGAALPSRIANADALYDSAAVPHDTRWSLPLPGLELTLDYLERVLNDVLERLDREGAGEALGYFLQLAAYHEEMHCEAFTYTRQTLGYRAPEPTASPRPSAGAWPGDVEIPGGPFRLGADPQVGGFVFDNEKWMHPVNISPFQIARAPVTQAEFATFVGDDGYGRRELWSTQGWQWRERAGAQAPLYWTRSGGDWARRVYHRVEPLAPNAPVIHVNWFEADAWCRWAGRRLPTEAEWECAAATSPGPPSKRRFPWGEADATAAQANLFGNSGGPVDVAAFSAGDSGWGCRQLIGNVWEWTATAFGPYPGFVADPYQEYSQPWFGDHKVLRGGSFATRASLLRNTWRNFYTPDRRDVFAGFRSCAL